jgi:membrane-bound lytic murein transglycosylase B
LNRKLTKKYQHKRTERKENQTKRKKEKKMKTKLIPTIIILICWAGLSNAAPKYPTQKQGVSWSRWVSDLKKQAKEKGIRSSLLNRIFDHMQPSRRVVRLDRSQPEKRLTYLQYRKSRIDAYRIKLGRRELQKHFEILTRASKDYGVNACMITALWGIETSYGRYMGRFPVVKSLASLAYEGRRGSFFRKELLIALHILNEGHISLKKYKGEWAGGSGHTQFLPSSWLHYAVDYNLDGRRDIWETYADVFASVANYLEKNNWKTKEPVAVEVQLPHHFDAALISKHIKKSVSDWEHLGVQAADGHPLPFSHEQASVVRPYGGPTYLAYPNYNALLRWNRSKYFALSVGYLADEICRS